MASGRMTDNDAQSAPDAATGTASAPQSEDVYEARLFDLRTKMSCAEVFVPSGRHLLWMQFIGMPMVQPVAPC